jgi:mercuric ion binding protein
MKNLILSFLLVITLWAGTAAAAGKEVSVAVKGMVCGFCAQGIEKKFTVQPAVEKVKVSLKEKRVSLTLKDGQELSDEVITKILADSGYNVDKVERK